MRIFPGFFLFLLFFFSFTVDGRALLHGWRQTTIAVVNSERERERERERSVMILLIEHLVRKEEEKKAAEKR
jgi:hypothetical protein